MGRELKRVKLDFSWPLKKPWPGFINPHYQECPTCVGRGSTLAMQRLEELISLFLISGEDARLAKCHPYFFNAGFHSTRGKTCDEDMVELTDALAGRKQSIAGYDSIDRWSATKKILKIANLPKNWGVCKSCKGDGIAADKVKAYKKWKPTNPPKGVGYQIWETGSGGNPISPVFSNMEQLARHMATTRFGAATGTSYEFWLKFIAGPGFAPSSIADSNGVHFGVDT